MVDSEPHHFLEGEARCARAFCGDCSVAAATAPSDASLWDNTCPYHLLQGVEPDSIAVVGPGDKSLAADAPPADEEIARSEESDPSSDGVEVL